MTPLLRVLVPCPSARLALEHAHRRAAPSQRQRRRQSDDAAADDRDVDIHRLSLPQGSGIGPSRPTRRRVPARYTRNVARAAPDAGHECTRNRGTPCYVLMFRGLCLSRCSILKAQYARCATPLLEAVTRVCDSQRFIHGPEVEGLERELEAYLGRSARDRHVVGHRRRPRGADGARHRPGRRGRDQHLFVLRDGRLRVAARRDARARRHRARRRSTSIRRRRSRP